MGYFGFLYEKHIENIEDRYNENEGEDKEILKVIGFETKYKFNIILGVLENMPKDYKIYLSSKYKKVEKIELENFRYCKIDLTTTKQLVDFPNNICLCNLTLSKKLKNMLSQKVDINKIRLMKSFFMLD